MVSNLTVKIGADIAGLQKELNKATGQLDGLSKNLNRIGGLLVGAFSVKVVADFTMEVIKLAGQADGVRRAFEQLPNSTKLMQDLKLATGNTVSELELMKQSVRASNFDISLKQLPKLLEFATVRAQQTGESVDYLVDSIVKGIGRKSPLILDNLGISSIELKKRLGDVSIAAADVGTVTRVVGEIAAESLQKSGSLAETTTVGINRLAASWENLKVVIGKAAESGGWMTDLLTNFAAGLDTITQWFSGPSKKELEEALAFFGEAKSKAWAEKDMKTWYMANNAYQAAFMELKKLTKGSEEIAETLTDKATPAADKHAESIRSLSEIMAEWNRTNSVFKPAQFSATDQIKSKTGADFLFDTGSLAEMANAGANSLRLLDTSLAVNSNSWDVWKSQVTASLQQAAEKIETDFAPMVHSALAGIGQALGSHMTKGMDKFGHAILGTFGGILIQLGEMLLATGLGVMAFKKSLASLNPAVAIGAGIGLIALGTSIAGSIKGLGSSAGSSGRSAASSGGGNGSSRGGLGTSGLEIMVGGEFRVQGQDLVYIFNRQQQQDRRTRG